MSFSTFATFSTPPILATAIFIDSIAPNRMRGLHKRMAALVLKAKTKRPLGAVSYAVAPKDYVPWVQMHGGMGAGGTHV